MRINVFVAAASGLSRRAADKALLAGRVTVNGQTASLGTVVSTKDIIKLDGQILKIPDSSRTILLNKPAGYVCSRDGQGSKTIYDFLPKELHNLKSVGRLDKDSSGLLLLTDDGQLAHQLTHPSFNKEKIYQIELDRPLTENDHQQIEKGVKLDDGLSRFHIKPKPQKLRITKYQIPNTKYEIIMREGRNRQIRRTFKACGYEVLGLHRITFGPYNLDRVATGKYQEIIVK